MATPISTPFRNGSPSFAEGDLISDWEARDGEIEKTRSGGRQVYLLNRSYRSKVEAELTWSYMVLVASGDPIQRDMVNPGEVMNFLTSWG